MPNDFFEPFANNGGGGGSGSGTVTSVGITPGGGISVTGGPITDSGSIEVAHADTSSQASVDNSGRSFIQDVTLDEYGHVTELGTGLSIGLDQNGVSYTDEATQQTYTGHVTDEIFNDYSGNVAIGGYSHAEGAATFAIGPNSHAEGFHTHATGLSSHSEGDLTISSGFGSHAEGQQTTASGSGSHAEGGHTVASGERSHAEGAGTVSSGQYSHAEGRYTEASRPCQHVQGKYNVIQGANDTEMAMIIGNGTANNARSNALSIDWNGNIYSHNDPEGIDIRSIIAFGDCESSADTQHKVATMADNNWRRHIGCIIAIKFKYTNTYAASSENHITLNVNGTGDANIYYGAGAIPTGTNTTAFGYANRYIYYIWNGTYWVWLSQSTDNNTTYSTIAEENITNSSSSTSGLISGARAKGAVDKYAFGTNTLVPYDVTPHSDLDNYTAPGTYYVNSNVHAADVDNCPVPIGGRLVVMTTISDDYLLQIYYTNQEVPQIFVRRRVVPSSDPLNTTSPWSKWVCVTFATNGIEIPDNADLDDYTTPGVYNHGLDNVATLSNCPITTSGFRLEVVHIAFNTRRQQRLYPQSTTSKSFFIRTEDSNGFGDWVEYADVTTIKNEIFGPGTLISSGAITGLAPGRYYTQDSSSIAELPNGFSGAFYCTVEKTISTNSDAQGIRLKITLQPCETANLDKTYTRFKTGNGWSEWKESAIEMTILSYGNSTWDEFMKAYLLNSIVYCRAGSSTPQTSPQLRLAFMAYVNDEADPTEVEFQYYRSVSNKSDSAQGDEVYVYKLNKTSGWSNLKRNAYSKVAVASPITKSYASGTITIGHANSGVTAGTYDSVTVDAQGHVTAGSNYTIDSTPTENSTNLVTSGGVQAPLAEVIDNGEKNLLNNSEAVSQTVGGVTFTLNADGSITANGTKNNDDWFIFSTGNSLKAGTYVLYDGLPVATQNCQLLISTTNSFTSAIMATRANSRPVTQTLTQNYTRLYYAIRIASGTVVNNLTFYPMLCTKAQWDISQAYEPYVPTNRELYEMIGNINTILQGVL